MSEIHRLHAEFVRRFTWLDLFPKNLLKFDHLAQGKYDFGEISAEVFGRRIMIFGPSASGKSTMAVALGKKLNIPVHHLDQLCFIPKTFWDPRPAEEFRKLHEQIIDCDEWIIDGNYSKLMPPRIMRATAIIWLNPPTLACIFNFYKRFFRKHRSKRPYAGLLEGAKERFTFTRLKYIFQHKRKKLLFSKLVENFPKRRIFYLDSFKKIRNFFEKIQNQP
jgi:adenylate kinase family enzyme